MRSHQLLLTSALLSQAVDSSIAFQIPHRNIIAGALSSSSSSSRTKKTKSSSRSAASSSPRDHGLITKLIPTFRKSTSSLSSSSSKKSKSKSHPRKKRVRGDVASSSSLSNKQILALATTCCLTCLLRPTAARAAAAAMGNLDPMMITYDMMQVPNLGRMPPAGANAPLAVMPGMYTLLYRAWRRLSPRALASSLLVASALAKSAVDGSSYRRRLSDKFKSGDDATTAIEESDRAEPIDYVQYSHVLLSSSEEQIEREEETTTDREIPTSSFPGSSSSSSSSRVVEEVVAIANANEENTSVVELNELVKKSREYEEDIRESLTSLKRDRVEDDYLGSGVE